MKRDSGRRPGHEDWLENMAACIDSPLLEISLLPFIRGKERGI
ncbi:MAG: hypothetical protein Q7W38_11415 [Deltaproteobacteria bacterium]|nr:hypothetical protein [Deltaproteobacteria bacterium]